jgi:hypothetical protein
MITRANVLGSLLRTMTKVREFSIEDLIGVVRFFEWSSDDGHEGFKVCTIYILSITSVTMIGMLGGQTV